MNRTTVLVLVLMVLVTSAGCARYPSGPEVDISYYGTVNVTDSTFTMNGYLQTEGGIADQEAYRNVTLYLLTEDGTVLATQLLGDLEADYGRLNVTVETNVTEEPYYVVFDSADFWAEQTEVDYFRRTDGDYTPEEAGSKSELPTDLT